MATTISDILAESQRRISEQMIPFRNKEHETFYYEKLARCRYDDVYHKALVYCLGLERDTRDHVDFLNQHT